MSNSSTFLLGLGAGVGVWCATRRKVTPSAIAKAPTTTAPLQASTPSPTRNGSVAIHSGGIAVDGARADVAEAVSRCSSPGRAVVRTTADAPASLCAELVTALRTAGVATQVRPLGALTRNGAGTAAATADSFSLVTYPRGIQASPTLRYFRAEQPIAWTEAHDRLAAAGVLDLALAGKTREPGGWMLSIDRNDFRANLAEPLPGGPRNAVVSTQFTLVTYAEGVGGPKKQRWFLADAPTSWDHARDRLADAGLLDRGAIQPLQPGYWILVTSPEAFRESKAEPLPRPRRRGARKEPRYTTQGRKILRDGEPILYVDRVDLGNQRYAISPHHADLLTQRMARLLSRHGA